MNVVNHAAEIDQDVMPMHNTSKFKAQDTEQSEFRKLPQLDSFESGDLKNGGDGSSRVHRKQGDLDDPVIRESQVAGSIIQKEGGVGGILDSKAFFSRQAHRTLLSSMEFHSGIKEI